MQGKRVTENLMKFSINTLCHLKTSLSWISSEKYLFRIILIVHTTKIFRKGILKPIEIVSEMSSISKCFSQSYKGKLKWFLLGHLMSGDLRKIWDLKIVKGRERVQTGRNYTSNLKSLCVFRIYSKGWRKWKNIEREICEM